VLNGIVTMPARPSQSNLLSNGTNTSTAEVDASAEPHDPAHAAADPPVVPRFLVNGRRRSNTGPRAPPSAFRNFTGQPIMPSSTHSFATTNTSSDLHSRGQISPTTLGGHSMNGGAGAGGGGFASGPSSFSGRTGVSDASGPSATTGVSTHNFFESVGTVRMEAFVKRSPPLSGLEPRPQHNHPRPRTDRHGKSGRERGPKHDVFPLMDTHANQRAGGTHERGLYAGEDPFRGF
jgi:hypothetical protein